MSVFRLPNLPPEWAWLHSAVVIVAAVLVGLFLHAAVMRAVQRVGRAKTREGRGLIVASIRRPSQWLFAVIAAQFAIRFLRIDRVDDSPWDQFLGFAVPALFGWLAIGFIRAMVAIMELRADVSVEDNLAARRIRTRTAILGRIAIFFVAFIAACLMLLSIPAVRSIGVTLMASAGIAGLVVGAAAQPALKNLIAGIQMAFTEPIRLDDVVIVGGEWGRIEEIRLTFVTIKLWDERRLVVPVSKFLEDSFQNWTRETSRLLGSVFWHVDPATDIARLRAKVGEAVQASALWDGRFWNCQVTDSKPDAIEVRGLMTAKDASTAFDLRCEVREAVLTFLRTEMPEALPRMRVAWPDRPVAVAVPG